MTMRNITHIRVGNGPDRLPVRISGVAYPPHLLLWDMKQEGAQAVRERVLRSHEQEREVAAARAEARQRARQAGQFGSEADAQMLRAKREEAAECMAMLVIKRTKVRLVR